MTTFRQMSRIRQGTLLIIVSGLCAMLMSLSLMFLARMRGDARDILLVTRMSQARLMLVAGCNYIQEASRLGWEYHPAPAGWAGSATSIAINPADPSQRESYGWIDVRDGYMGPKNTEYTDVNGFDAAWRAAHPKATTPSQNFPIGSVARCPMYVMRRPPCAIQLTVTYNPISSDPASPDFGLPYFKNLDPKPQLGPGAPSYADWVDPQASDPDQPLSPRQESVNLAWFRVYRDGPATFVITCGAGPTQGFRSWAEMTAADRDIYGNDQPYFEDLLAQEYCTWYRVEWSAAVQDLEYHIMPQEHNRNVYLYDSMNISHMFGFAAGPNQNTWNWGLTHQRNMVGTIKWVQRLVDPPTKW